MTLYHLGLYVHLLALIVAASASAVTKVAAVRRAQARTVAEALDWHDVLLSSSRLFPMCLATFVVTGSYMLSVTRAHVWSTGFVVAGFAGAALLLASGVFLATKGKALRQVLATMAEQGADRPAPKLVPPPLVATLPAVNTGIALAVAFDMVMKPASVAVALGVVAIGIGLGTARSLRRPAPAARVAQVA
jgi:hypothetical protein